MSIKVPTRRRLPLNPLLGVQAEATYPVPLHSQAVSWVGFLPS